VIQVLCVNLIFELVSAVQSSSLTLCTLGVLLLDIEPREVRRSSTLGVLLTALCGEPREVCIVHFSIVSSSRSVFVMT
jgi:hypothetical protein